MVKGIEHTAIASPDPHKLAAWYVDHLEFVVNYQSANSKTTFVKAADGSMIEIIESNTPPPDTPNMKAGGLRHLAIGVTDFESVYQSLKAKGVRFLTAPEKKSGNAVVFFTDCDGNIVHLIERAEPLP
jgi:glyoxylase I family protein